MSEWNKILPIQIGEKVRIKSFSTYAKKDHRTLDYYLNRKGTILFIFGDDIFVEMERQYSGPHLRPIHLHMQDVERV